MNLRNIYLALFFLLTWSVACAQQNPLSNLRKKWIGNSAAPIVIDTLSLVPGTFIAEGVPKNSYALDEINATLNWLQMPALDSVLVRYRVFL